MFSVELPVKLNHTEFRGNNLLFDLDRPSDLLRPLSLHTSFKAIDSNGNSLCLPDEFRSSYGFF